MLEIKQWAFSLCAAMVAAGLIRMLAPGSGVGKMLRLVVSVFFLCCLLSPAVIRDPSLTVDFGADAALELERRGAAIGELAMSQTAEASRGALEEMVREKLSERGIKVHDVAINIVVKGQNEISLESVEIILDWEQEKRHDELVAELKRELGAPVRLGYSG